MEKPSKKRFALLACGLALALPVCAADEIEPGLDVMKDLGRLNGQALACEQKDTAAWIRILMLTHAPKTRSHGEAYEAGTQEAFAAQGKGAPCPDSAESATRIEKITQRLREVFPAAPPAAK